MRIFIFIVFNFALTEVLINYPKLRKVDSHFFFFEVKFEFQFNSNGLTHKPKVLHQNRLKITPKLFPFVVWTDLRHTRASTQLYGLEHASNALYGTACSALNSPMPCDPEHLNLLHPIISILQPFFIHTMGTFVVSAWLYVTPRHTSIITTIIKSGEERGSKRHIGTHTSP